MKLVIPNRALLWVTTAAAFLFRSTSVGAVGAGCFPNNAPFHRDDWMYCQEISETLYMYYSPLEDTVMLGLHVTEAATGWTSLATAGNGGMKGASQIVVRKDEQGEWVAEDRYSMDYVTPALDEQQDVQLLFAQQDEDSGETAWGVVIPQNSCDEPYDYEIEDKAIFMLWALGTSHSFDFHGRHRGQFMANLMGPPAKVPDLEAQDHVDIQMPNVPVVLGEGGGDPTNPYICAYFDMKEMGREMNFTGDDKVHVTRFSPFLDESSAPYVHHMVLMSCVGDSSLQHLDVIPECEAMPPGCTEVKFVWAVGMEDIVFPEGVGMPIGEGSRWMVIQMHYFNPALEEGIFDSSGVRAYITKDLMEEDAGVMHFIVAVTDGQQPNLPGGQEEATLERQLFVPSDCSANWEQPLNVVGVFHHMHFLGKRMEINVERDGKNLGLLRKENYYDYKHQSVVEPSAALKTLYPGDKMSIGCTFDTSSVSTEDEVLIGEESDKEMCYGAVIYYPRQKISSFMYSSVEWMQGFYLGEAEWCWSPPETNGNSTLLLGLENQCASKLYYDIPAFTPAYFNFLQYEGPSFGLTDFCSGGNETALLRQMLPHLACPEDCFISQNCTTEELVEHANSFCSYVCGTFGYSMYPNTSGTVPLVNSGTFGCPTFVFEEPVMAPPPVCQAKGTLPMEIELTGSTAVILAATSAAVEEDVSALDLDEGFDAVSGGGCNSNFARKVSSLLSFLVGLVAFP